MAEGEDIVQTYTNCTVSSVAGDQINYNNTTIYERDIVHPDQCKYIHPNQTIILEVEYRLLLSQPGSFCLQTIRHAAPKRHIGLGGGILGLAYIQTTPMKLQIYYHFAHNSRYALKI